MPELTDDNDELWHRINREVDAGRLWRAKEIMRGNIATKGYDPYLFERYGHLLLTLGEQAEAGKYLFLSGARLPEYDDAITLYLARFTRNGPQHLYRTFPAVVRRSLPDDYPQIVREDLHRLGVRLESNPAARMMDSQPVSGAVTLLASIGCTLAAVLFITIFLVGVAAIIRAIMTWP